jgi:chromosome segregation ATPase
MEGSDDRLNQALQAQLLQTQQRVKRELQEQEDELKAAKVRREDVGLELYSMQQQLSKLQGSLEAMNERHAAIVEKRARADKRIVALKETHKTKQGRLEEVRQDVAKTKAKLDAMLETLRQAKRYNEDVKREVAITRTVASKAGEDVREMKKDKQAQDVYIEGLYEQVRRLEADVSMTDAQLKAQREQTYEANKMIQQTNAELEVLVFEKKQLVQQWRSSILALNRRDQALVAAAKALSEARSRSKDYAGEMQSLKTKMAQARTDKENLSLTNHKLESEARYLKQQIDKARSDHESAQEEYEKLEKCLAATDKEEDKVQSSIRKLENEIEAINHKIELVTRNRKDLEEQIGTNKHEQTTVSKATMSLMQEERAILSQIHDREIEAANMQNRLSRLQMDAENSQSKRAALQEELEGEAKALRKRDEEISQREIDIRRRNEEIEKKMSRIDQLNRKYEQMLDGVEEGEPMGPLEATIKSLTRDVESMVNESNALQKQWLAAQTNLVQIINEADATRDKNAEVGAKLNILRQRRLRLIQDIHINEAEIRSVQNSMEGMHSDMIRLNELIAKTLERETDLVSGNAIIEKEFARDLKDLDRELVQLDARLADIDAAKTHLLDQLVEAERQTLHWEKKIQLEKETQAALHTSGDAKQIKGMEKEIDQMKKRLEGLRRDQERIMVDIEKAIHQREDINVKYLYWKKKGLACEEEAYM